MAFSMWYASKIAIVKLDKHLSLIYTRVRLSISRKHNSNWTVEMATKTKSTQALPPQLTISFFHPHCQFCPFSLLPLSSCQKSWERGLLEELRCPWRRKAHPYNYPVTWLQNIIQIKSSPEVPLAQGAALDTWDKILDHHDCQPIWHLVRKAHCAVNKSCRLRIGTNQLSRDGERSDKYSTARSSKHDCSEVNAGVLKPLVGEGISPVHPYGSPQANHRPCYVGDLSPSHPVQHFHAKAGDKARAVHDQRDDRDVLAFKFKALLIYNIDKKKIDLRVLFLTCRYRGIYAWERLTNNLVHM